MKALKNILITIIGIAFVLGLAVLGTQIYFKKKHDIDIFATIGNFKTMSKEVDEGKLFPDVYGTEDQEGAMTQANASLTGLVKCDEETKKYSVDLENISGTMAKNIDLSEKQLSAFAQMLVESQLDGKLEISESTTLEFCVKQIKITDVKEDGSATFNIVVRFDLSSIKEGMTKFPMTFIKKYVPDFLYVSSTVDVTKDATDAFKYTITSKSLTFNNLTSEETKTTFKTLDYFLKTGSADTLNEQIGETVMSLLVGKIDGEEKTGLACSLSACGATGFKFTMVGDVGHFVITTTQN